VNELRKVPQVAERSLVEGASERVDANVVGAGVQMRQDADGNLVAVSPGDDSLEAALAAAPARSSSARPLRSRLFR
jgi:hypothetical protein